MERATYKFCPRQAEDEYLENKKNKWDTKKANTRFFSRGRGFFCLFYSCLLTAWAWISSNTALINSSSSPSWCP